jgi:hypothetical protein
LERSDIITLRNFAVEAVHAPETACVRSLDTLTAFHALERFGAKRH